MNAVCVSAQVVRLDSRLLFFHQLCKLKKLRGHQTDDEQLHVSIQPNIETISAVCLQTNV